MHQLTQNTKLLILNIYEDVGWKPTLIAKMLLERHKVKYSATTVLNFLRKYEDTASINRKIVCDRKTKISKVVAQVVQQKMIDNNEVTNGFI